MPSGPHLPSSGASSISARRAHLHSLPDSNHPAAATPTEWQPAPATRVLLLPGRLYHQDHECLKSNASQLFDRFVETAQIASFETKAVIQRGSIEHEQIINMSFNCHMKRLMDWLSNPH